jgi:hypothetical protein
MLRILCEYIDYRCWEGIAVHQACIEANVPDDREFPGVSKPEITNTVDIKALVKHEYP